VSLYREQDVTQPYVEIPIAKSRLMGCPVYCRRHNTASIVVLPAMLVAAQIVDSVEIVAASQQQTAVAKAIYGMARLVSEVSPENFGTLL
jgi:hypothetical protein